MARSLAGEITQLEAFQEVFRADPSDVLALAFLAIKADDEGDLAAAERYARDLIRNNPSGYQGYMLLARILGQAHIEHQFGRAYLALAMEKLKFDEDTLEDLDLEAMAVKSGLGPSVKGLPKAEMGAAFAAALMEEQGQERVEVEDELRPHRLVHELREHREGVLDRSLVDSILEYGAACEPLLMGILKEFGSDLLTDDDYRMVERALVLLGEIGNPSVLPALIEFLTLDEQDLSGPADWAFRRISFQHPAETLEKIRELIPTAAAPERVVMAEQMAMMPKVAGKGAVLSLLTQGIDRFPKADRDAVIFGAIAAFYLVEGGKSFQAAQLERKYAQSFSGEARADLRTLHRETEFLGLGDASPDEHSIFDICCKEPDFGSDEDDDEEADARPPIKQAPKPGRNEPCWCGSGKKYKKCHLEQDQRA